MRIRTWLCAWRTEDDWCLLSVVDGFIYCGVYNQDIISSSYITTLPSLHHLHQPPSHTSQWHLRHSAKLAPLSHTVLFQKYQCQKYWLNGFSLHVEILTRRCTLWWILQQPKIEGPSINFFNSWIEANMSLEYIKKHHSSASDID